MPGRSGAPAAAQSRPSRTAGQTTDSPADPPAGTASVGGSTRARAAPPAVGEVASGQSELSHTASLPEVTRRRVAATSAADTVQPVPEAVTVSTSRAGRPAAGRPPAGPLADSDVRTPEDRHRAAADGLADGLASGPADGLSGVAVRAGAEGGAESDGDDVPGLAGVPVPEGLGPAPPGDRLAADGPAADGLAAEEVAADGLAAEEVAADGLAVEKVAVEEEGTVEAGEGVVTAGVGPGDGPADLPSEPDPVSARTSRTTRVTTTTRATNAPNRRRR